MRREYHPGERAVQERAGVSAVAARIGNSVHAALPPVARAFLEQQQLAVLAAADARGRPWASALTGAPGFLRVVDERTVRVAAPHQPASEAPVTSGDPAGLVVPDFATRRRLRVNGRMERASDRAILIRAEQVYANCPKYIQRRTLNPTRLVPAASPRVGARAATLTEAQREWIRRADTFFIATLNPGEGADASHRGGMPGFVSVAGDRLTWADYAGNNMFNTLGNITVHPYAGLLFPDFVTGATLHLTGLAALHWKTAGAESPPDAGAAATGRLVELVVEEVVEMRDAWPVSGGAVEYSPFNPSPAAGSHAARTAAES